MKLRLGIGLVVVMWAGGALAQVPARQQEVGKASLEFPAGTLKAIKTAYAEGRWSALQTLTQATVKKLAMKCACKGFDEAHVFVAAFVTVPPGAKDPEIVRYLVGPRLADFSLVVPGQTVLGEVFLSANPSDALSTDVRVTRERSPLESQAIAFAKGLNLAAFHAAFFVQSTGGPPPEDKKQESITGTFRQYAWEPSRGTIAFKSALVAGPRDDAKRLDAVAEAAQDLTIGEARISPCALELVQAIADDLVEAIKTKTCRGTALPDDGPAACVRAEAAAKLATATCRSELTSDPALAPARNAAVASVPGKLLAAYEGSEPKPVSGTAVFADIPASHLSFGLVAGALLNEHGAERAKISDDGKVARDPLDGALTMAVLNWQPVPYYSADDPITVAQRWRLFAGYVITPEPGLAAGGAVQIIRGLSFNAGFALLRVKTPARGVAFGDASAGLADGGLTRGTRSGFFVGFGYSFP